MPPTETQDSIGDEDQFYRSQFDGPRVDTGQHSPESHDAHGSAQQSSSKAGTVYVPFLDRLRALPEKRAVPWRPGQELPPERSINSPRVQQRGAILLSTRGAVTETPCSHCAAGYGRFSVCITLEQWFQGACSSCIFTSKGNKCSLRFQTSGMIQYILYSDMTEEGLGTADGRALRYHADNPDLLQSFIRSAAEQPAKPSKKRKRNSAPASTQPTVNSTYSNAVPRLESPLPQSPD